MKRYIKSNSDYFGRRYEWYRKQLIDNPSMRANIMEHIYDDDDLIGDEKIKLSQLASELSRRY